MNTQDLTQNVLSHIKKNISCLGILDFRQYIFSYLFIISCFIFIIFNIFDSDSNKILFDICMPLILLGNVIFVTAPITLVIEMISRAFLRAINPELKIIKYLDLLKKMDMTLSMIFYLLFAFSVFTFAYPYWIEK